MFAAKNELLTRPSGSYQISRSLRFRSSASAYLSRTPGGTGNQQKFTWSGWVKRGKLSATQYIYITDTSGAGDIAWLLFNSSDQLQFYVSGTPTGLTSTQVFRDPSSWYHISFAVDTTQATASNRIALYVNGVQITAFTGTATYYTQNTNVKVNTSSYTAQIGGYGGGYFDGYLAEVNFIDGQALTPSSFGAFDTNGIWQPAKYTGSYGTNGFYLPFSDNSALTTASNAGIGKDFSGNSNYWVTNNINISAYSGTPSNNTSYDSIVDTPTNYSDGLNGVGNYPVANPNAKNTNITISNGNLTTTSDATTNWRSGGITFGNITSGKWYYEATATTISSTAYVSVGWQSTSADQTSQGNGVGAGASNAFGVLMNTSLRQTKANASTVGSDANTNASGDIIMVAVDFDNSKAWIGKNGTWYDSGNPSTGANPIATVLSGGLSPAYQVYNAAVLNLNFGQRPFTYTPPSGFSALNTQNLP